MSKSWLVLLGTLSFAPLLGFFLLVALVSHLVPDSALFASNPDLPFQVGFVYVVGSWVIVIGAIVLALRSYHIRQSQRIFWALALFFFNMFVLPIFWYKCVWKPVHGTAT